MRTRDQPFSLRPLRYAGIILPLALTAMILIWWPISRPATPVEREIRLDASQFEFIPGRFIVKQGDRVVVTLTASDVVHGFYLDGYELETRVEPGIAQRIEFVADRPGKFRYRCAVSCGPLHPFMIGELIVSPNNPFWKAFMLLLITSAGMLIYLWKSKNRKVVL